MSAAVLDELSSYVEEIRHMRELVVSSRDRVQEGTAALGLARAPDTALERLQASRARRDEDRGAQVESNVERAGQGLAQQDQGGNMC